MRFPRTAPVRRNTCRVLAVTALLGLLIRLEADPTPPSEPVLRIRHVEAPHPLPFNTNTFAYSLDLDGNAVVDFFMIFHPSDFGPRIQPNGRNRQAAMLSMPPDFGSWVAPFRDGEIIGGDLPERIVWVDRDTPNHNPAFPGASTLNACAVTSEFVCIGLFTNMVAYMAVQFESGLGRHFGWVRIDARLPGGVVIDWAYDTRPGIPIRAGAMPGQGMLALQPPVVCDGVLWLTVSGQLGKKVILEKSEDFGDWTAVSTNVSPFQTGLLLGQQPPHAFFRAVETE